MNELVWGITGHRKVDNYELMKKRANILATKAKKSSVILSLGGAHGWDWEVLKAAYQHRVYYYLHFPFRNYLKQHERFVEVKYCLNVTWEKTEWISKQDVSCYHARNTKIVDDLLKSTEKNRILQAYWDGRKQGGTLKCIQKAFAKGARVFNWFNMSFIDKSTLPMRY